MYVSVREFDGTLAAQAFSIGDREVLRRVEIGRRRVALQTVSGHLLQVDPSDARVVLGSHWSGHVESFLEIPLFDASAPLLSSLP